MRGNTKHLHLVFSVCVAFVLFSAFASVASARTIYVPDDYENIQWAVDNASAGDTIIVRDGIYYESITVSKHLTIKSENGSDNCIVNGGGSLWSDVFTLEADRIRIEGFTITGGRLGIYIHSSNNKIINNNISSNNLGIDLKYSNNNIISNNNISSNKWGYGIHLLYSNNNSISNNNIISNNLGIDLDYSNNNSISENNICSNNLHGIWLDYSNNNIISNNNISSNKYGIYLLYSNENTIRKNEFINDGIFIYDSYSNIVEDNEVNGEPLVYLEDESDRFIDNAGQIILVRCSNITVMNAELTNTDVGIELFESDNCLISNNNISSNSRDGIRLYYSNNNIISNNNISSNSLYGIYLLYSNENTIRKNEFINDGIYVRYSYGNIVEYNKVNGKLLVYLERESDEFIDNAGQVILVKCKNITVMNSELTNTDVGIELWQSDNCLISNNNISSNSHNGIWLDYSNNNSILNNIICSNNRYGIHLGYSNNNSISENNISNNYDGIHLLYSNNNSISENIISSNKWDGISLCESNNNSISENIICSNNYNGIGLGWYSNKNSISENIICSSNFDGISLYESNNNIISKNIICLNKWYGINLEHSNNNIIYINNFMDNTYNTYSYDSKNIWNSTESITYTYRGSKFENYMGNYWDDYTGYDENGDGIGDIPYSINADKDNYPLIERFENYFMPTPAKIFDTGRPENPYPSISGKFIGTIKTNKKIIAKKLYTYACEGTGGHTEHALICNSTWCAEAKWKGYKEDWMNISFNKTVILMPHETYNITIVTGSYPQIHHTPSLKTENGWINCTEFTDANGKKYENWIPAIKLWS